MNDNRTYEVFKGNPQKKPLWLGSVKGRTRAVDLMNRMAARLPDDYFVLDTITQELVDELHAVDLSANPSCISVENARHAI